MSAVIFAVAANASALGAEQVARRAECIVTMKGYQHDGAAVEAARAYASCVYDVYGSGAPMPFAAIVAIKVLIVVALIGGAIGVYRAWRDPLMGGEIGITCLGGLLGMCLGPFAVATLGGIAYGILYLFS